MGMIDNMYTKALLWYAVAIGMYRQQNEDKLENFVLLIQYIFYFRVFFLSDYYLYAGHKQLYYTDQLAIPQVDITYDWLRKNKGMHE